jgi:hypothetical protein
MTHPKRECDDSIETGESSGDYNNDSDLQTATTTKGKNVRHKRKTKTIRLLIWLGLPHEGIILFLFYIPTR